MKQTPGGGGGGGRLRSGSNPFILPHYGHAKIGKRAKSSRRTGVGVDRGGSGERRREHLPANPTILRNTHRLFTVDLMPADWYISHAF